MSVSLDCCHTWESSIPNCNDAEPDPNCPPLANCGAGTPCQCDAFYYDCDDGDPTRSPGNSELCDATGSDGVNVADEDCDLATLGSVDQDNDGLISNVCCNPVSEGSDETRCGTDCNDTDASVGEREVICASDEEIQVCTAGSTELFACSEVDSGANTCFDQPLSLDAICAYAPRPLGTDY